MDRKYTFENPKNFNIKYTIFLPKNCPLCGAGIGNKPAYIGDLFHSNNTGLFYTLTECFSCDHPFLSIYELPAFSQVITKHDDYPRKIERTNFEIEIDALFPRFVQIYNQSELAEACGLFDICGAGYRRSLEFLIKTYLIQSTNEDQETIEKATLSQAINKINDEKLRKAAIGGCWLGNDFTHYKRKYEKAEIDDLKQYIMDTVGWIILEMHNRQDISDLR